MSEWRTDVSVDPTWVKLKFTRSTVFASRQNPEWSTKPESHTSVKIVCAHDPVNTKIEAVPTTEPMEAKDLRRMKNPSWGVQEYAQTPVMRMASNHVIRTRRL